MKKTDIRRNRWAPHLRFSSGVSMVMRLLEGRRRYASLSPWSVLVIQCEHVRKEAVAFHETYPDVFQAKFVLPCDSSMSPHCFLGGYNLLPTVRPRPWCQSQRWTRPPVHDEELVPSSLNSESGATISTTTISIFDFGYWLC